MRASSKYILEFRSLFLLLLDEDPEILESSLSCLLKLCKQPGFMRGINKKEIFPKLINLLGRSNNFTVLKRAAKLFIAMLEEVDVADHEKFAKKELTNLLEIVKQNEHSSERFSRTARLLFKSLRIVTVFN
jgi:site-specific recombinase